MVDYTESEQGQHDLECAREGERVEDVLDEVICDRCGRDPGITEDGVAYCHVCSHECTFTRGELEPMDDRLAGIEYVGPGGRGGER